MSLIDKARKLLGGPDATIEKSSEFATILRASLGIVGDFGQLLDKHCPEDGFGLLQSEKRLPHPKETIMKAICFLKVVLSDRKARALVIRSLAPEEAEYALSDHYSKALEAGQLSLDMFVPEPALEDQKKLASDTANILDNLSANDRKKFEESLPTHAIEAIRFARDSDATKFDVFHMNIGSETDPFFDESSLPSDGQPRMVILMGGPAVGKTTVRKEQYSTGYVLVDAVPIFLNLCRGKYLPFPGGLEEPMNLIGTLVTTRAITERRNIVTELIGGDAEQLKNLVDAMRAIGYKVDVNLVHCPIGEAVRRNLNRDDKCISAFYAEKYQRDWLLAAAMKN